MAGGDLDVAEVNAGVEHGGDVGVSEHVGMHPGHGYAGAGGQVTQSAGGRVARHADTGPVAQDRPVGPSLGGPFDRPGDRWWQGQDGEAVKAWLGEHPRLVVHFTPTHASWMNLVEVWFGIVERQAIRRGVFKSVKDLNTKIRTFIDGWNDRSHPFVWTKPADDILKKANRPTTSNPRH